MASRTIVEMTDDVDGKPATETVKFALDCRDYEIDLSDKNEGAPQRLRALDGVRAPSS